jgi:hypothetical protein
LFSATGAYQLNVKNTNPLSLGFSPTKYLNSRLAKKGTMPSKTHLLDQQMDDLASINLHKVNKKNANTKKKNGEIG